MKQTQISKKTFVIVIFITIALILGICGVVIFIERDTLFPKTTEPITEIRLDSLGSAERLEENVAVVSIFVNDKKNTWDFSSEEDKKTRSDIFGYMDIAAEWIDTQAKRYNKSVNLLCADSPQSDLYYETSLDDDFGETTSVIDKYHINQWQYIENNIPSEALKQKYDCRNVVYLFFINSVIPVDYSAYAVPFYAKECEYPYELCVIPTQFLETVAAPSVIIHEILHCFGAPDLYKADGFEINYGTTNEFVLYCEENIPNDIMFSTYAVIDGEEQKVLDRIENEITDITAYYLSWLDEPPPAVDEFGLVHNQFENYNG